MTTKFVYSFSEGNKDLKDLLGGKGANLAEMMRIGIPVPPGFTITTEACKEYLSKGAAPLELEIQITKALRELEDEMQKRLGDKEDPLLVSVRSGAKFSMPGMMETILNVGLNDQWAWTTPDRNFSGDFLIAGQNTYRYDISTQTIVDIQYNGKNYTLQCIHNGKESLKTECEKFISSFQFL